MAGVVPTHCSLTVGEVDADCAVLASDDLHVVRLPLALLPADVAIGARPYLIRAILTSLTSALRLLVGMVIDLSTSRSLAAERTRESEIRSLQAELQARLGPAMPPSAHDILSS